MNGTDTNIPNSSSSAGSELNNNDGLVIKNGILEQCETRNRSVAVPIGVHTIGKGAFKGCTSLEQILLPDTVTVISDDAFKGCRKLTEITHFTAATALRPSRSLPPSRRLATASFFTVTAWRP